MISHGHDRRAVLYEYSAAMVALFYEKAVLEDLRKRADFIEDVAAAIGGAFGGMKKLDGALRQMRGEQVGRK